MATTVCSSAAAPCSSSAGCPQANSVSSSSSAGRCRLIGASFISSSVRSSTLERSRASSWTSFPADEMGKKQRGGSSRWGSMVVKAGVEDGVNPEDIYEVELEKPFNIRLMKGGESEAYIEAVVDGSLAQKLGVTPGDKVLATSAAFGTDMWPAAEFGRVQYTIMNRIGTLKLRLQKRNGERPPKAASATKLSELRKGNMLGDQLKELQYQNYQKKMEEREQREALLTAGLKLYKAAKYEAALEEFESVLKLKPAPEEAAVTCYNLACCYSKLGKIEEGLTSLQAALESGFEDFKAVRSDPDLNTLRTSPKFMALLEQYDEPFINENALNAIKGVFGFFGKK